MSVACARMVWDILPTDARNAVSIWERYADDRATDADARASRVRPIPRALTFQQQALNAANIERRRDPAQRGEGARHPRRGAGPRGRSQAGEMAFRVERRLRRRPAHQAELIRDIFPPPGYTPVMRPDLRTDTVVALARQMDDTGDFFAVPILADALQDAGCDDDILLARCRAESGIHCRGNWVVDLVLGRE